MAHKKKHTNPVPPANQPQAGPPTGASTQTQEGAQTTGHGAPFQEQDPKRRLGGFSGKGEHPLQQPSSLNDANR